MSVHAPWRWTAGVGAALELRLAVRARTLSDRDRWTRDTARIQIAQLRWALRRASHTSFGREHGFDRLARLPGTELHHAYQEAVPVRDWYGFADRIAAMREGGEPDQLWPGRVMHFAQTSGTTAGDKFIPVSEPMMRSNYLTSLDIFAHLMRRGVSLPRLTCGTSLFLGGSSDLSFNEHGIATGDLSGLVTPLIRWPISEIYSPGPQIALEAHWPTKIERMARLALEQDVRMVSGMPSWFHVLAERVLELARQRGRPGSRLLDVWPHLTAFVHGGVNYRPFERRLHDVFSGGQHDFPHRVELYPASEGFVAMQDEPGDASMRLNTDRRLFFEFVPIESIGDDAPESFPCWEVETGRRYVVVLTTCAGLWRYILGDVVEFDSVCANLEGRGGTGPCRLRIVGRHRHFINAFGENLIVEHIEHAVNSAARETGLTPGEFTAAPVYPDHTRGAGLELLIEMPGDRAPGSLEGFAAAFDRSLMDQNVDYTTKRTDGLGMTPPTITPLAKGAIHAWMESRGKLGGQHKCPRCANHREIVDAILEQARAAARP